MLIPRPETELLAGEVLAWAAGHTGTDLRALDLGTGSGALALSLATEGNFAHILATDVSKDAIKVASGNGAQYHDGAPVEFRVGPLYQPVGREERFDVIVSNPPYVPSGDMEALQPEVRDWEPRRALAAGPAGMGVLAPLIAGAPRHLASGGLLALETGPEQVATVAGRIDDTNAFAEVRIIADLAGRQRMVLANRSHGNRNR